MGAWKGAPYGRMQRASAAPTDAHTPADAAPVRDSRLAVRGSALSVAVLNLLVLLCFALPFASVSCGESRTKTLTGWELASGADAGIRTTPEEGGHVSPDTQSDLADLKATLGRLRLFSGLELFFAAIGVLAGVYALVRSSLDGEAARAFLLPGTIVLGLSFVASLGTGAQIFGPDVHHYEGFWLAAVLSWLAILPALVYGWQESRSEDELPEALARFQWVAAGVGLVGALLMVSPAAPIGLVIGGFAAIALFGTGMFGLAVLRLNPGSFVAAVFGGVILAFVAGAA